MTPVETFKAAAPALLEAAQQRDHRIGILTRQALRDVFHYECPIAFKLDGAWVFVIHEKLESPNRFRAHWSLQNGSREKWEKHFKRAIERALGIADFDHFRSLGQTPACVEKMTLQIVRLVGSSREFIRDDDNLHFSRKGATDSLKRLGLLKDDRREWLDARTIYQDVAPNGRPLTVFLLWPAAADLFASTPGVSTCLPNPSSSTTPARPRKPKPTTTSRPRLRRSVSFLIP